MHRHGLWLFGVLAAFKQGAGHQRRHPVRARSRLFRPAFHHHLRLANFYPGLDVHPVFCAAGFKCGHLGWLAGTRRSAQGGCRLGLVLVRRHADLGAGRLPAPVLDDDFGLGCHWRHWPGAGLHLARVHPDQVVPGPPGHGHRHGHHGLWRRRHDRLAPGGGPDEAFRHPHRRGRDADLCRHGPGLLCVHDGRRLWLPCARDRLETRWLDAATRAGQRHDHAKACAREQGLGHSAVLADLDGAVYERERRYWRDRHGFAHVARGVWRRADRHSGQVWRARQRPAQGDCHRGGRLYCAAEPVQHWRALLLGQLVRQAWPQAHLCGVLCAWRGDVFQRAR